MGNDEFDVSLDVMSECLGRDADSHSPTLRRYHQLLWSKPLPSGGSFDLVIPKRKSDGYLIYGAPAGPMWFGSDAITNSYTGWMRPRALVEAMAGLGSVEKERLLNPPYTVASAMIWPVRSEHRPTINQARGTRAKIADRMDLTLECIRRHYRAEDGSPLQDVLANYADFFALFMGFRQFVDFFHFQDLVASDYSGVEFFLPFDGFETSGVPASVDEYVVCREGTIDFEDRRRMRMAAFARTIHMS
jgi:hypothetical protein